MAAEPVERPIALWASRIRLAPFEPRFAATVAGWLADPTELFFVAPKTVPPITPAKVIDWPGPNDCPYVLLIGENNIAGYAELNPLEPGGSHVWIGHFVIDPRRRRRGYGAELLEQLLTIAFEDLSVGQVSLTVFPENVAAVACYKQAGFISVQTEERPFASTGRVHRLTWMKLTRRRYLSKRAGQRDSRWHRPRNATKPRPLTRLFA